MCVCVCVCRIEDEVDWGEEVSANLSITMEHEGLAALSVDTVS